MEIISDRDLLEFVSKQQNAYIASPGDFADEIAAIEADERAGRWGDRLPWTKTWNTPGVGFRPGELTIWSGYNGSGKSQMLGMVVSFWLHRRKVLVASLEQKPARTIRRMMRQCSGLEYQTDEWKRDWYAYTNGKLYLYDRTDTIDAQKLIALCHAAKARGCHHVVIDSLLKAGLRGHDGALYENQKHFVDALAWAAKSLNIHIHLVAHAKKPIDENKIPSVYDISGSSDLSNMAFNVCAVWRNKKKHLAKPEDRDRTEPDAILQWQKNRDGDWLGSIALWFHRDSQQFTESKDNLPLHWGRPVEGKR